MKITFRKYFNLHTQSSYHVIHGEHCLGQVHLNMSGWWRNSKVDKYYKTRKLAAEALVK